MKISTLKVKNILLPFLFLIFACSSMNLLGCSIYKSTGKKCLENGSCLDADEDEDDINAVINFDNFDETTVVDCEEISELTEEEINFCLENLN